MVERPFELIEEAGKYKGELVRRLFPAEAEAVAFRAQPAADATLLARRIPTTATWWVSGYGANAGGPA